jgi:hypothetical protein
LKDPLDIIEDTLVKFGEVAAAIADCDEKHPVSSGSYKAAIFRY